MSRPLLLDLFSGAGGSAVGYHRAGFDVVGVDIAPQPNYPFEFIRYDALEWLILKRHRMTGLVAIHASPPCQRYSKMAMCRPGVPEQYPDLIEPLRELLIESGLPYVIENVPSSPLIDPIFLCGTMFGYELYRHRRFESSIKLHQPPHPKHTKLVSKAGHWTPGTVMSVSGHVAPVKHAREIMDISWTTRDELVEAVPPYYTEYIGRQLLGVV